MDTTVERVGAAVVGELRAAGYMESTIGQYQKSIRALAAFVDGHGGVLVLVGVHTDDDVAAGKCHAGHAVASLQVTVRPSVGRADRTAMGPGSIRLL